MRPMTEQNITAAFAGESQAHMKYLAFAARAEQQGLPNIARLFRAVATSEVAHAHYHLNQLQGISDTLANVQGAYEGEDFEIESMYPAFTAVAELEGEKGAAKAASTPWRPKRTTAPCTPRPTRRWPRARTWPTPRFTCAGSAATRGAARCRRSARCAAPSVRCSRSSSP